MRKIEKKRKKKKKRKTKVNLIFSYAKITILSIRPHAFRHFPCISSTKKNNNVKKG
jgi:hypothetical protein